MGDFPEGEHVALFSSTFRAYLPLPRHWALLACIRTHPPFSGPSPVPVTTGMVSGKNMDLAGQGLLSSLMYSEPGICSGS